MAVCLAEWSSQQLLWPIWVLESILRQKRAPWNGLCPPLLYRWGSVTCLIPEPPVMGHLLTCVLITLNRTVVAWYANCSGAYFRNLAIRVAAKREYFPIHCGMSVKGNLAEGGGRPGTRVGHCHLCHLGSRNSSSLLSFLVEGLTC